MKITKYLILAISALIYSNNAFAGFGSASTVLGYDVGDANELLVRLSTAHQCGGDTVVMSNSTPYYKDVLSTIMLAYSTQQPVYVYVSTCSGNIGRMVRIQIGHVYY